MTINVLYQTLMFVLLCVFDDTKSFRRPQVPLTDPFFKEMFQTRVNTYPYIQRLHSTAITEEDNCTMLEIQVCHLIVKFGKVRVCDKFVLEFSK